MTVSNNMPHAHMKEVMEMYKELPSADHMNFDLYQSILKNIKAFDDKLGNGVILSTLQSIVLMMCESCVEFGEGMRYKEIQEDMK